MDCEVHAAKGQEPTETAQAHLERLSESREKDPNVSKDQEAAPELMNFEFQCLISSIYLQYLEYS